MGFNRSRMPYGPVAMSSERRKLVLGASWTLASTMVALGAGAILNPILVLYLGVDGYGIWASAIAIASLFGLGSDLGISGALTKFIAERRGGQLEIGSLAGTALTFGLVAGCVAGAGLFGLSFFMERYVSYDGFPLLLQLQAVQMPLNLGTASLLGVIQGRRQFRTLGLFTIGQAVVNLCLSLVLLALGQGIPGVMVSTIITSALMFLVLLVSTRRDLVYNGLAAFKADFRRLVPFGLNLTVTNALSTLLYNIDIVALSIIVRNPAIVGAYALAVFVTRALWILPSSIGTTTYPVISEYAGAKDERRVAKYLSTALAASVAVTGTLASALVIFGRPLFLVVFGPDSAAAYDYAILLLLGTSVLGSLRAIAPSLAAVGRPDVGLRISALGVAILAVGSFALVSPFGPTGAAISVSIAFALVSIVLLWAIDRYVLRAQPGLQFSPHVATTSGVAIGAGLIALLVAVPTDLDVVHVAVGAVVLSVTVSSLILASGGRDTWGTFFQSSRPITAERS